MASDYFTSLNAALRRDGMGRPCILLDLDRVDHNLGLINENLARGRYRVVTKSLPSVELIRYVLSATGSNKLMAFHLPFVQAMLDEFDGVDVLMGKPFLISAIGEFFDQLGEGYAVACERMQWLIDTRPRLEEFVGFAADRRIRLRVNIEIDVGLHRGGVSTVDQLDELLSEIANNTDKVQFSGFMGYEAHVPFMPEPDVAFDRSMAAYREFVEYAKSSYPQLWEESLTFNSGGSKTYDRFSDETMITDVAAGSAAVKPATFATLEAHRPALFIAAPVIRKFPRVSRGAIDPATAMSLYLYGGGWAADLIHPPTVTITPFADPPNQNLLPNQCLFETFLDTPLELGDFVFFQPQQSDAMFQFDDIHVMREGRIVDRWKPFSRRF